MLINAFWYQFNTNHPLASITSSHAWLRFYVLSFYDSVIFCSSHNCYIFPQTFISFYTFIYVYLNRFKLGPASADIHIFLFLYMIYFNSAIPRFYKIVVLIINVMILIFKYHSRQIHCTLLEYDNRAVCVICSK